MGKCYKGKERFLWPFLHIDIHKHKWKHKLHTDRENHKQWVYNHETKNESYEYKCPFREVGAVKEAIPGCVAALWQGYRLPWCNWSAGAEPTKTAPEEAGGRTFTAEEGKSTYKSSLFCEWLRVVIFPLKPYRNGSPGNLHYTSVWIQSRRCQVHTYLPSLANFFAKKISLRALLCL